MTDIALSSFPKYEAHQRAWEELAQGIAALKDQVHSLGDGAVASNSNAKKGELIIIGTGIESIGVSVGDQKILEIADKVLYCIADPATIVWLNRLRPDALDLYVLYGEDKIRYTTYMQMAEAQLYWVRQGLKVVVVFYGHPGIFVLSTHRAIQIARREGHKAIMKAGVSALDALCADLGIDPSHPGLQTHEATDCLTRRRHIDTSLHVILWQVGLIGELGYRRHGYLNNNFSYFVNWLAELYGSDYPITHYIGSRYPTIDSLIETYALQELHDPKVQTTITGLSTFYIPPRDVVPTDYQTAIDLGILKEGQRLVKPASPLRDISQYERREMEAFRAFEKFHIPSSYRWQEATEASHFLIELRFDPALQDLYRSDPLKALDDPRFKGLSDKERAMLASRDSGAIQIAAKGAYKRSSDNERLITHLLNSKVTCSDMLRTIDAKPKSAARTVLFEWMRDQKLSFDWSLLHASIDHVYRNNLYPWTGVYLAEGEKILVTLLGKQTHRHKSILYVNGTRIPRFQFQNGILKWDMRDKTPFNGFLKFDVDGSRRRLIGKIWTANEKPGQVKTFVACEADPSRKHMTPKLSAFHFGNDAENSIDGEYAVRTTGRFAREVTRFSIRDTAFFIDNQPVQDFELKDKTLGWSGGIKDCFSGQVSFLLDPIINSIELYGQSRSEDVADTFKCYGTRLADGNAQYGGPPLPEWAQAHLVDITEANQDKGGLMLWHKWEKFNFTHLAVAKYLSSLI